MWINEEWPDGRLLFLMRTHLRLFELQKGFIGFLSIRQLSYVAITKMVYSVILKALLKASSLRIRLFSVQGFRYLNLADRGIG